MEDIGGEGALSFAYLLMAMRCEISIGAIGIKLALTSAKSAIAEMMSVFSSRAVRRLETDEENENEKIVKPMEGSGNLSGRRGEGERKHADLGVGCVVCESLERQKLRFCLYRSGSSRRTDSTSDDVMNNLCCSTYWKTFSNALVFVSVLHFVPMSCCSSLVA